MNKIKDTLEKNPVSTIISLAISCIVATYVTLNYFNSQELSSQERKINELTNTIATLKFGVTNEGYINIDKLLISSNSKDSCIVSGNFIPDLNLFVSSKKIPLEHHISNKNEVIQMFSEDSRKRPSFNCEDVRFYHRYNSGKIHKVKGKYAIMGMVFPSIMIEKYNIDSTYQVGAFYDDSVYFKSQDKEKQNRINELNIEFHNDPLTRIFLDLFRDILDESAKSEFRNNSFKLHSFDKRENLVHFSMIFTMNDVYIDDKHYDKYYMIVEDVIVYNKGVVTHISTFVPSENSIFANAYKGWINEWLADLRVVID